MSESLKSPRVAILTQGESSGTSVFGGSGAEKVPRSETGLAGVVRVGVVDGRTGRGLLPLLLRVPWDPTPTGAMFAGVGLCCEAELLRVRLLPLYPRWRDAAAALLL